MQFRKNLNNEYALAFYSTIVPGFVNKILKRDINKCCYILSEVRVPAWLRKVCDAAAPWSVCLCRPPKKLLAPQRRWRPTLAKGMGLGDFGSHVASASDPASARHVE